MALHIFAHRNGWITGARGDGGCKECTGCMELLLRDGRKISIDCTGVEDALDMTMRRGQNWIISSTMTRWVMLI